MELLFLPVHEPITGHDLGTLHKQERKQENRDQDLSISGSEVCLVDPPGNGTNVPLFILHDRLASLELLPECNNHIRSLLALPFLSFLDFVDLFLFLLLRAKFLHELGKHTIVGHELSVSSAFHDLAVGDRINVVDLGKEVQSVGDKDLGSAFGVVHEHLLEHRSSDVGIQSGEGILKVFGKSRMYRQ